MDFSLGSSITNMTVSCQRILCCLNIINISVVRNNVAGCLKDKQSINSSNILNFTLALVRPSKSCTLTLPSLRSALKCFLSELYFGGMSSLCSEEKSNTIIKSNNDDAGIILPETGYSYNFLPIPFWLYPVGINSILSFAQTKSFEDITASIFPLISHM